MLKLVRGGPTCLGNINSTSRGGHKHKVQGPRYWDPNLSGQIIVLFFWVKMRLTDAKAKFKAILGRRCNLEQNGGGRACLTELASLVRVWCEYLNGICGFGKYCRYEITL